MRLQQVVGMLLVVVLLAVLLQQVVGMLVVVVAQVAVCLC
jgi:hypothetical protein